MQSFTWYIQRFKSMSPSEIVWRMRSEAVTFVDRYRIALGLSPTLSDAGIVEEAGEILPGFRATDMKLGAWGSSDATTEEKEWLAKLIEKADKIVEHKLSFFDLQDKYLGDPIDWNRDHGSNRQAPMCYAQSIDYRDFNVTGDCKLVWEPNRHHHLVVLGRAYRASGDKKYAVAVIEQIDSWLQACPFGKGMGWRSPMELAIRLINWVWSIDLIRESGLFNGEFRSRLLHSVYLHLWEITRKYSRGSSANNHLVGEAAGVFIATSYFPGLHNTAKWREESKKILSEEIFAQTYSDGCTREQALGYQLFVLQFYIVSAIVARKCDDDFTQEYWSRLERILKFIGYLYEGGVNLPIFGDQDDGYVLDLGSTPYDPKALLSTGAVIFQRAHFKVWSNGYAEPTYWLFGRSGKAQYDKLEIESAGTQLESRGFRDSGYYLLQSGGKGKKDSISILFDCGELGFKSIAAHGHADALSFTLRVAGVDVFVDPGTYDYFTHAEWRRYFRSTRSHNTVVIDDVDQSVMLGSFMWGEKARVRCVGWNPRTQGGSVTGEHDGYTRLADPVVHRRTVDLDGVSRMITIKDEISAQGEHSVALYFHLSEYCTASLVQGNTVEIVIGERRVILEIDQRLTVSLLSGSDDPIGGWVSRGYHLKSASTTIAGRGYCHGSTSFICKVMVMAS